MGNDWLIELFNTVDIHVVDSVCHNMGYELTIENGVVTNFAIKKGEINE